MERWSTLKLRASQTWSSERVQLFVVGWKPSPNPQKLSKTYCHISPIWTCHRSFFIMFILLSWQPSVSYIWPKFACSHSLDTEYWIYDKLWGKALQSILSPAFRKARHLARLVKDFHSAWASGTHVSINFTHVWLSIMKPLQPHFTNM